MTVQELRPRAFPAHELYGDYWLNGDPVQISILRGRVVLLEFWDLSRVSCIRTMPYLAEWHRKYQDYGLVVAGIHTPRFDFGKNPEHVADAIMRFGITCPVVLDNQHGIALSYDVRDYPSMVVIDKNGFVRYRNTGEGDYDAVEQIIQSLLYDAGVSGSLPLPMEPVRAEDTRGAVLYRVTPELVGGYARGNIGNPEAALPEDVSEFTDPDVYVGGRLYVDGAWFVGREYLQLRQHGAGRGKVIVKYSASEVHGVFMSEDGGPAVVELVQDGEPLRGRQMGDDVVRTDAGRTQFVVTGPRSYSLIRNPEFGDHTLTLLSDSDRLKFYSIAFVSGVIPETISRN